MKFLPFLLLFKTFQENIMSTPFISKVEVDINNKSFVVFIRNFFKI